VEQRILEQSMRVGSVGAVTGWAALRLYGAAFFDGLARDGRTRLPVPLVSPHHLADTQDSVASRVSLADHRVWVVQGMRCVGVERAVVDEISRVAGLREAVVVIDMACAARITSLKRIESYAERHPRGNAPVLAALALADEHSLSPQETLMRLVWVLDAGGNARCATGPSTRPPVASSAALTCSIPRRVSPVSTTERCIAGARVTGRTSVGPSSCEATGSSRS